MFASLFSKQEQLIAIDIGSTALKLVELDHSGEQLLLKNVSLRPLTQDIFQNNSIATPQKLAEEIEALLQENEIEGKKVVTAVPGPSVFTKKLKVPGLSPAELRGHIHFEAANLIPQGLNSVKLDYHILGSSGKNQLEVLLVAVKNEVLESFSESFIMAGIEPVIVDVDYFAVQNLFERLYPAKIEKTTGIIHIGARYSAINICRGGATLFTGDIPFGGRHVTDGIAQEFSLGAGEAEKLKKSAGKGSSQEAQMREYLDKTVEQIASDFNRQMSFFWNTTGADGGLDEIVLQGGGSLLPGLIEELNERTGIPCTRFNPFEGITIGEEIDGAYLAELSPHMAVALGLGLRELGDRVLPEDVL